MKFVVILIALTIPAYAQQPKPWQVIDDTPAITAYKRARKSEPTAPKAVLWGVFATAFLITSAIILHQVKRRSTKEI